MSVPSTLETYRHIFDNVNDAIFVHDLQGRFLDVNRVACQRLGYTRPELLALRVQQIDAPEFAAKFGESIPTLIAQKSLLAETCHITKEGRRIPSEVSARFIDYQGQQAVLSVVRDISERKNAEAEIHNLQEQIQTMATQVERERLGRELHDGLGQVLGFISLKTAALLELLDQQQVEQARQIALELHQITQAAYADVREAILGLRSTLSPTVGLDATLREYFNRYQHEWNLPIQFQVEAGALAHLAPSAEIQLLRIIQEALVNVRRHAHARQIYIRVSDTANEMRAVIEDDGIGFDPRYTPRDHFGLQTMRERADSCGGHLEIDSTPGQGTRLLVRLPYRRDP